MKIVGVSFLNNRHIIFEVRHGSRFYYRHYRNVSVDSWYRCFSVCKKKFNRILYPGQYLRPNWFGDWSIVFYNNFAVTLERLFYATVIISYLIYAFWR